MTYRNGVEVVPGDTPLAVGRPTGSARTEYIPEGSIMTTQDRLETLPHLNGRHRHTWEAIFRHPAAYNLEWHDVRSH